MGKFEELINRLDMLPYEHYSEEGRSEALTEILNEARHELIEHNNSFVINKCEYDILKENSIHLSMLLNILGEYASNKFDLPYPIMKFLKTFYPHLIPFRRRVKSTGKAGFETASEETDD